jgi:SIR2-like domain/Domain of unknown function (DUF4020)
VFAGAGVSYPPPSSLPLFGLLAEQIGKYSTVVKEDLEREERYLGRVHEHGVNVHERAAEILLNPDSKPHELHRLLLELFPSPRSVRLVTTNFDNHFSIAAEALFDSKVETFYGPALPLGYDFTGLVYLHGCAGKDAGRCVLTDGDFGRAYLTDAWATRFLAAMFARYVVLFVGYSHNDPVMNYLARGLSPTGQKPRFALTTEESVTDWKYVGVCPLVYTLSKGENRHQAISDSMCEWVKEIQRGLLDKTPLLRSIAEAPPPLDEETASYTKFALSEPDTASIFFKYARMPEWIFWLEDIGYLKRIFDPKADLDQNDKIVTGWLVAHHLTENDGVLLSLVQRSGGRFHPVLGRLIWLKMLGVGAPTGTQFSRWIAILVSQPDILQDEDWAMLLGQCKFPEHKTASILLFAQLTKARLVLEKRYDFATAALSRNKVGFSVSLFRPLDFWLKSAWEQLFHPNLKDYKAELESIVTANLVAAHSLLQACDGASGDDDPFQFKRQSIEPHDQNNNHPETIDLLIDAARDILGYILENDANYGGFLTESWFDSHTPILKRLAISGFEKRKDRLPDEKIGWLIENDLLYRFKTDVFGFLKQVFPTATEPVRKRLVEIALLGPPSDLYPSLDEKQRNYIVYNLLVWLSRTDPDCSITQDALKRVQAENPHFEEREFPELHTWTSGAHWIDPLAGFDIDDIVTQRVDGFLEDLLAAKPDIPFGKDRSSYCSAISSAVKKNFNWGIEFARLLASRRMKDTDLWAAICYGWSDSSLSDGEWQFLLHLADSIDAPAPFFEEFVGVLERGLQREKFRIPNDGISKAQNVARRVWARALESAVTDPSGIDDWFGDAINQPGGKLAEFWIRSISVVREVSADSWKGIPDEIAESLHSILANSSNAGGYARAIFATSLDFFFSIDSSFFEQELLPLFNWQTSALHAEQCWNGFLQYGRWLPGFVSALLPHFERTVARIDRFPEKIQERVVAHVATSALYLIDDPFADGWLPRMCEHLSGENLTRLAIGIDRLLDDSDIVRCEAAWDRWLLSYWNFRRLGTPRPLSHEEADAMACWSLSVGKYFPKAAEMTKSTPIAAAFRHTAFLYRLKKKKLANSYPQQVAELVVFCLKSARGGLFVGSHLIDLWNALRSAEISESVLNEIRSEALRHGIDLGN